jgi:cell filamentation protein
MRDIGEASKARALSLFGTAELAAFEVGTTRGLQQIHSYPFGGLYDFAGQIRSRDISKDGFRFASSIYLHDALRQFEKMPEVTFE